MSKVFNYLTNKKFINWKNFINNKNIVLGTCVIKPYGDLFKHKHKIDEYYFVMEGKAKIYIDDEPTILEKNMLIKIPKYKFHYTKNILNEDFKFMYIFENGPFEEVNYYT